MIGGWLGPIALIVNCLYVVSLSGIQIEIVLMSMFQRLDERRAVEVFKKVAGSFKSRVPDLMLH